MRKIFCDVCGVEGGDDATILAYFFHISSWSPCTTVNPKDIALSTAELCSDCSVKVRVAMGNKISK